MYLIFDTETTGLPRNKAAPITDLDNWPRIVQLSWQLHEVNGKLVNHHNFIIYPEGYTIPFRAEQIHGISTQMARDEGRPLESVISRFCTDLQKAKALVAHNIGFDISILRAEFLRLQIDDSLLQTIHQIDTCVSSKEYCALPGGVGGVFKYPKLTELYKVLFDTPFSEAHNAAFDAEATARCFFELLNRGVISHPEDISVSEIEYEQPDLQGQEKKQPQSTVVEQEITTHSSSLPSSPFVHLHVHSQFSILQATPNVSSIIAKAKELQMPAIALTDFGNLCGAYTFVVKAIHHKIKPIVGCELYVAEERKKHKFTKDHPDRRYTQVVLAKNKTGYQNLCKLSSLGYTEGLYGLYPRVDKELILHYREGLIATTGGVNSEIPYLILHVGEQQAEEAFVWWKNAFGEDFYIELNRHGIPEDDHINRVLLQFSSKYDVPYFAANENYYLEKEESHAHDILLCIKEGKTMSMPVGLGRSSRTSLPNDTYYFRSQEEMKLLFHDLPQSITTLTDIIDKIETYTITTSITLPAFAIPKSFSSQDDYLRHLTYEGAKKKYTSLTDDIRQRIDYELDVIQKAGYAGYFLIVQDITNQARKMGVMVGPGRGSAAGSAVSYCIGITQVDPITYGLLFERFLNPDRVSMPDIDIDFDDEGREKVLDYVMQKYGEDQVAQIITYGTLGAKSSIRDCARVLELPLSEANTLAKLVPDTPGISLAAAFKQVDALQKIILGTDLKAQVLKQAQVLEGSLRNTGIHACGLVITPEEITNLVPIARTKDSNIVTTQFDNLSMKGAGLLKMDFLALTTLSIIKTALKSIQKKTGQVIDIEKIPLDDPLTFQLYQEGQTTGTFQFESRGMRAYLKTLKSDKLEDLIAMNALYRPGPMAYIPNFIARKHGREPIQYDLPDMEEILSNSYGITIYQEQVMLLSQKLAGFSKGDADVLRKAMSEKLISVLHPMKDQFIEGCTSRGYEAKIAHKIWKDWESFAAYAFNKSHSTCYALQAYQTAYLKAHFPSEYMAAVLTHSYNRLTQVTFFIEECKRMKIDILGPDINESGIHFEVNQKGNIRFGLGGIKGLGMAPTETIIDEREKQGPYKTIFDFAERTAAFGINKKIYESLALSGTLDGFGYHRRQYVEPGEDGLSLTEKLIRYATRHQVEKNNLQLNLFTKEKTMQVALPKVSTVEPFAERDALNFEKEMIGVYLSGHPLDHFQLELEVFCNITTLDLQEPETLINTPCHVGGIVSAADHRFTKTGRPYGRLLIEDYRGKFEFVLWSEDFIKFKSYFTIGLCVFIEGAVEPKKWGDHALEFKIRNIELLSGLMEKKITAIVLFTPAHLVDHHFITQIETLYTEHPGTIPLKILLEDDKGSFQVELLSRKVKLKPTKPLCDELRHLGKVGLFVQNKKIRWLAQTNGSIEYKDEQVTIPSSISLEGDK